METNTMGVVLVTALIENYDDVKSAEKSQIAAGDVRRLEISDTRVDTGATRILDALAKRGKNDRFGEDQNVIDLYEASRGQVANDQVRRVEVAEAIDRAVRNHADQHRSRQDNRGAVAIRDLWSGLADDPGSLLFGGCLGSRGGVPGFYRLRSL